MANQKDGQVNDQIMVRREKMEELRKLGIDPFGKRFDTTTNAQELHTKLDEEDKDVVNAHTVRVVVAGRMMSKRGKGKVGFADIQDRTGRIQIYVLSLIHI